MEHVGLKNLLVKGLFSRAGDIVCNEFVTGHMGFLIFGISDHGFNLAFSDGFLIFSPIKEIEYHWHSDVVLALAVFRDKVLFVIKLILKVGLETSNYRLLVFFLCLPTLGQPLLCHGEELDLLFRWADLDLVVTLQTPSLREVAEVLQPADLWLFEIVH